MSVRPRSKSPWPLYARDGDAAFGDILPPSGQADHSDRTEILDLDEPLLREPRGVRLYLVARDGMPVGVKRILHDRRIHLTPRSPGQKAQYGAPARLGL